MFVESEIIRIQTAKIWVTALAAQYGIAPHSRAIIAGGVFIPFLNTTVPDWNDIDVFVLGGEQGFEEYAKVLSETSVRQDNAEYMKQLHPHIYSIYQDKNQKVQYIFTHFNTREELIKNFDYVHCCISYDFDKLHVSKQTYDAIMTKRLVVNNQNSVSEYRRRKFIDRGFME
jgi:hypothetical protein